MPNAPIRRTLRTYALTLTAGAALLSSGCASLRTGVMLPFEVAERTLGLASTTLDVAGKGVDLVARTGRFAFDQIDAEVDTAETGVRVLGDAARLTGGLRGRSPRSR